MQDLNVVLIEERIPKENWFWLIVGAEVKTKFYPSCLPGVWLKCSMRRVAEDMLHVVSGCDETKCWLWRVTWRRDSAGIFTHDNILLRYNCYLAPACLVMNVMSRVTLNICFPCSPFHLAAPALTSQILLSWYPEFWKTGRYKDSVKYMKNLKQRQTDYEIITLKLSSWFIIIALLAWII